VTALDLRDLSRSRPGLSSARGAGFAEAAAVCLEFNSHAPGVTMRVDGDVVASCSLNWTPAVDMTRQTWGDLQEATEHGSYGIAALLLEVLTGLIVVERSAKGPGFDYWLGRANDPGTLFQDRVRLEVSGILSGAEAIPSRVAVKRRQILRGSPALPAYIVIVEFGTPLSRVVNHG
jgi:hypothetical protein